MIDNNSQFLRLIDPPADVSKKMMDINLEVAVFMQVSNGGFWLFCGFDSKAWMLDFFYIISKISIELYVNVQAEPRLGAGETPRRVNLPRHHQPLQQQRA